MRGRRRNLPGIAQAKGTIRGNTQLSVTSTLERDASKASTEGEECLHRILNSQVRGQRGTKNFNLLFYVLKLGCEALWVNTLRYTKTT